VQKQLERNEILCSTDKRGTTRYIKGRDNNPECFVSDDVILLGEKSVGHRISRIRFFSEKNKIFGFAVDYTNNGDYIEGLC
jgi:hypothetical protein